MGIKKIQISNMTSQLKQNYTSNQIIKMAILNFCYLNNIKIENLNKLNEINKYLNFEYDDKMEFIFTEKMSFKNLESIFENLIDMDRKKAEGAVYTPDYIIDYIVNYSLNIYDKTEVPIVCDPSCGCGGFLIRTLEILNNRFSISYLDALSFIKGIDINSQSVSCAKIILELFFVKKDIDVPRLDDCIICSDTLLTPKDELLKRLSVANKGVDILVTNPPYVKLQNIPNDARVSLIDMYQDFTQGSFSTAMLFLIAGQKLLKVDGVLGYITQNNLFTSLASKNIRKHLQETKAIHTIVDFLHTKVFENASAYTCLIFLKNNANSNSFNFKWALNPKEDLNSDGFSDILVESLSLKKWRLAPKIHLENIIKMENVGKALGKVSDIKVGFATLKDKVFLLDNNNTLKIEDEILVSAIKIAELKIEDDISSIKRQIIFPYKSVDNKFIAYTEIEMKERFPIAYKYLLDNKDLLNTRSVGKSKLTYFYEWGRTQGMSSSANKLLTKTFAGKPNFMIDKTSSVICNGYSVKPNSDMEIEVLQKILNSVVMDYYSKLTSFQLGGNFQCFQKNFIETFGIPNLSQESIKSIRSLEEKELDLFVCTLYDVKYDDVLSIVNR